MITLTMVMGAIVAVTAVCYGLGLFSCRRDRLGILAIAALVLAPPVLLPLAAQDTRPAHPIVAAIPQLVAGLEATPGCLGVELARTASGKQAVFAWFEDKRALMRWYSSEAHQYAIQAVFPGHQLTGTPLKDLPDDAGPILSIASFVMADPSQASPGAPPFRQIAIEHYAPLAGGISVGGRFAPAALKVPGLREIVLPPSRETGKTGK
jgi:hypothetical protein